MRGAESPSAQPELLSLGECMVELFGEEAPAYEPALTCTVGGDALNVLVAAARLGARTGFITRVGQDIFAELLLGRWQTEGVDLSCVRVMPGFNGLYVITVEADGERSFTYYRAGDAASTLEPADLDAEYLRGARLVHTSGITQAISASARAAVRYLASLATELGVKLSYDPNFRPKLGPAAEARLELRRLLPHLAVVLPSAGGDEALLWGTADPEAIATQCLEAGCEVVAVKMGAQGCYVQNARESYRLPAVTGWSVVDTTGAGDAFDGAFLLAYLRQAPLGEAAQLANLVAAIKCGGRGALGHLPTAEQVARAWPRAYGEDPPAWLFA
ncbi:MAG: sugar kinase [Armatimonadetes bacterium]|nr:sugar kinase [Armatimonadota bacterium]